MIDISFIVTVYNKPLMEVKRCLNSIKRMGSLSYEIVMIDDGSKPELKEQYFFLSQKYKANYYYQNNKGVSAARNLGINKAKGKYIFFVDCDDIVLNNKIDKKCLFGNPNLVIFNVIKEDLSTKKIEIKALNVKHNNRLLTSRELANQMIENGLMNWVYGKLYSVEFLHSYNLYFNTDIKTGEDLDFVTRVVDKAKRIKYVSQNIYKYEFKAVTGKNRITQFPERAIKDTNFVYQLRNSLLKKYNLDEKLFSVNKEQTLGSYFDIYYLCIAENLITKKLYKKLNTNTQIVEKNKGKIKFSTKIKVNLIKKKRIFLTCFYYKLKTILKNIGI